MSRLAGAILNSSAAADTASVARQIEKAQPKGKAQPKAKQLTRMRSRIDLDDDVEEAKRAAKDAKKQLRQKVTDAKLARKRKMRLVTKAAKLPADDLYRIALYKRVNLMNATVSKDMAGAVTSMLSEVDGDVLETMLKETLEKRAKVQEVVQSEGVAASPVAIAAGSAGVVEAPQQSGEAAVEQATEEKSPASGAEEEGAE